MIPLSDDLSEMEEALDSARAIRSSAQNMMEVYDTGDEADYPLFDAAAAAFSKADYEVALIGRHIWELEARASLEDEWNERHIRWANVL